jgi:hypothetical protein
MTKHCKTSLWACGHIYFSFCVSPFHKHLCFTRERTFNIISLIYGIKWLIARSSLFVSQFFLMIYQKTNMIHNSMLNILACNCKWLTRRKEGKSIDALSIEYNHNHVYGRDATLSAWMMHSCDQAAAADDHIVLYCIYFIISARAKDSQDVWFIRPISAALYVPGNWMKIMCTFEFFPINEIETEHKWMRKKNFQY